MNEPADQANASAALFRIKVIHTLFWAVFAGAIVAIPIVTAAGNLDAALWLSALVWIECLILFVNRMRCPLTGLAAQYVAEPTDGFDIFLPPWLARNNKMIFGTLFALAEVFLIIRLVA